LSWSAAIARRGEQVIWDWQADTWRHFAFSSWPVDLQGSRYHFVQNGILYVGRVTRRDSAREEPVLETPQRPAA